MGSTITDDLGWHEANDNPDAEREEEQVIDVAENGDEVGDEVNRAEGIGDNRTCHQPGEPGSTRVANRQQEGVDLRLEPAGKRF